MTLFLALSCIVIGFLCGATSIGGILLIPAIQYSTGMSLPMASGTTLCSFFFVGIVSTALHWKGGNLKRELVLPQCLGALLFGGFGAMTKYVVGAGALNLILGTLIILAGAIALRPPNALFNIQDQKIRFRLLLLIGSGVGFMAGLTGMGGPVISVPLMIIMGFPPFATVAAAQPFAMCASLSGSAGNFLLGHIDWPVAIVSIFLQSAGIWAGIRYAKRMDTSRLKTAIAVICIFTGVFMILR